MSGRRHFLVDTDTGSDDVWALVECLRARDIVSVEAITTVCGNLPLELCAVNALHAEEAAGCDCPPVYRGMERPLLGKGGFYAPDVHGADGLSNMNLPAPRRSPESLHAMDAIIETARRFPGELEIATIGPLCNIAMAFLREPRLTDWVKRIWILGGSAGGRGNMTEAAEYNVFCDPEAASIVLTAGFDTLWVPWDTARGGTELSPAELERLARCGDPAGEFCARCIRSMAAWQKKRYGSEGLGVIDTLLMTAALYPEIMRGVFPARCSIELAAGEQRGFFAVEREGEPNCRVCPEIDAAAYKQHLFTLLGA